MSNDPKETALPHALRVAAMGEGPWLTEPDRIDFRSHGFPCILRRVLVVDDAGKAHGGGHWCGYVGVPPGHPWHGQSDADVDARVHGGITYTEPCGGDICHVPEPGEPDDVWWLGFDAAHLHDLQPATRKLLDTLPMRSASEILARRDVYRDVAYMRAQCEQLAAQAASAAREKG